MRLQESAVVNGTFNVYEAYPVRLVVFENDLEQETEATDPVKSDPLPRPAQGTKNKTEINKIN